MRLEVMAIIVRNRLSNGEIHYRIRMFIKKYLSSESLPRSTGLAKGSESRSRTRQRSILCKMPKARRRRSSLRQGGMLHRLA